MLVWAVGKYAARTRPRPICSACWQRCSPTSVSRWSSSAQMNEYSESGGAIAKAPGLRGCGHLSRSALIIPNPITNYVSCFARKHHPRVHGVLSVAATAGRRVNVNVNETDWHRLTLAAKEAVSCPALGPGCGKSVNGFHQRVACASEVPPARRFRRDHRVRRHDGLTARAVRRSCLAGYRGGLEGRPDRLARVHGAPDRPGAGEPGRNGRLRRRHRDRSRVSRVRHALRAARPQHHGRVGRPRPHGRSGPAAPRPRAALLRQPPAMARRRSLAPHLPACAQRLPGAVGQLQVQFQAGAPRELSIVVGDGRSDFCVAGRADLVLAKGTLLDRCIASRSTPLRVR